MSGPPRVTDVADCALGRALRGVREETNSQPRIDWSSTPIGQFTQALVLRLAQQRLPREAWCPQKARELASRKARIERNRRPRTRAMREARA